MRARLFDALLVLALAAAPRAAAGASNAGQLFEFGSGARALGMGGAYAAAGHDVNSLYYNPSGLGLLEGRQVQFMHAALYEGAAFDQVGYAQNFSKIPGGWGLQVLKLGASGGKGRDKDNLPVGGFSYSETGLVFGMGLRGLLLPELSLGSGVKILSRSLGSSADKMYGVDLGAQYGPFADDRLTVALAMQNLVNIAMGDTSDKLPTQARLGVAYRVAKPLLLSLDLSSSQDIRGGAEYSFGSVSLRAGYAPEGLSVGGGMVFRKSFSVDIAVQNNSALGMSQRLSLGYRFGAGKAKKLSSMAQEYLGNGIAELERRNYLAASRDIDRALGIDSSIGAGEWKRKAARLRELVKVLDLENAPTDQTELAEESASASFGHRAVSAYLVGNNTEAMMLSHVAAGGRGYGSSYMRLLQGLARLTRQEIVREDILPVESFLAERAKRASDAIRAGRPEAGVRASQEALTISPEDAGSWKRLGSAYFASGDRTRAYDAFTQALKFDPKDDRLRKFMREYYPDRAEP